MMDGNEQSLAEIPTPLVDAKGNDDVDTNGDEADVNQATGADGATAIIMTGKPTETDYSLDGVDNPILRDALRLADRGKPVFPQDLSVNDATTNSAVIRGWWTEHPDANIMIRTGQESEIFVVVVEGMAGGRSLNGLESKHGYLRTHRVMTPAGGRDLYFKYPGKEIKNMRNILPGISISGDGGHVIAPPSIVRGWPYYWHAMKATKTPIPAAPDWLLEIVFRAMEIRTTRRRPIGRRPIPAHQAQAVASRVAA